MTDRRSNIQAQIIARKSASLLSLGVTMTVMCFLASLAVTALLLINRAVVNWDRGLSHEITVQLQQLSSADIEVELKKATTILGQARGVIKVEVLDRTQGMKLLEPWLGKSGLEDLPIPRLIRVTVDEEAPPDYQVLEAELKSQVKGIALDTHDRWREELASAGARLSLLAIVILVLISVASMTLAAFGARAALEANRHVVEVLRLVGAENRFIAREINRRFVGLGLGAGLFGTILSLICILTLGWTGQASVNSLASGSGALLYSVVGLGWQKLSYLLLVPLLSAVFVTVSARLTLMRLLENS